MSNSNQEIIEAKLATYIDGALDEADRAELETHLSQNPQYRRLVDELRKGRDMIRSLPREAAPTELAEAFNSQLERSELLEGQTDKEEGRMRIGAGPRILAMAAILFLTFGLAAIVYFVLPGRGGHLVAVAPPATQVASSINEVESAPPAPVPDKNLPDEPIPEPKALAAAAPPASSGNANKERDEVASLERAKNELAAAGAAQDAIARRKSTANGTEVALHPSPHDAELDQLAREVSADPHVMELLANKASDKLRGGEAGDSAGNAMVMVVRANDPEQVKKELYAYFGDHNIDWQPAPARVETAVNSLPSQQSLQLKQTATDGLREARSLGAEPTHALTDQEKDSKAANAAPSSPAAPASNAPAAVAAPYARPTVIAGTKSASPAPPTMAPKPTAAPVAVAPTTAPPGPPASIAPAGREAANVRRLEDKKQAIAPVQTNAVAIDTLYVARRLSHQQAQELGECLARSGEVRSAGVPRPLAGSDLVDQPEATPARSAPGSAAKDDALAAGPQAPQAAKPGSGAAGGIPPQTPADMALGQANRARSNDGQRNDPAAYRGGGAGAVPQAKRSENALVKRGDALRLSYPAENGAVEQAETVKVKDDGTIEPQALAAAKGKTLQAAGKTIAEIEEELQKSTTDAPAPTPPQPVKISRLDSEVATGRGDSAGSQSFGSSGKGAPLQTPAVALADAQKRRSTSAPIAEGADAGLPATNPAFAAADADNVVDVVIVVQKGASAAPILNVETTTPPAQNSAPVATPAPAPATQPAR